VKALEMDPKIWNGEKLLLELSSSSSAGRSTAEQPEMVRMTENSRYVAVLHRLEISDHSPSSPRPLATNASGPAELSSDLVGCDVEVEKKK